MSTLEHYLTAEELLDLGDIGSCELLRGELVMMSPASFNHGWIAGNIYEGLKSFVKPRRLGIIATAEAGFIIERNPDTVRAPDVSFIRAERIPSEGVPGFFPGAPDLAVEVLSPSDRSAEVTAKVQQWLTAGCATVWVVDPRTSSVTAHRRGVEGKTFFEADTLICENLLPGFSLPVVEIFTP
jgi:Uma2 family endonuclease